MDTMGEKLIELFMSTDKALKAENGASLPLKEQLLFLLSKKRLSPSEIMSSLPINKSNLAHLCSLLIKDSLIVKAKTNSDLRLIEYSITNKGRELIENKIKACEDKFKKLFPDKKEYSDAIDSFDGVLRILSFL